MAMMTGEQYVESMRNMNLQVYMFGEKIENPVDHPILRPSLNSVKATYDLAQDPEFEDLMTARSIFTGEKVCLLYTSLFQRVRAAYRYLRRGSDFDQRIHLRTVYSSM